MTKFEKVIKGLECCSQMAGEMCRNCPYAKECEEGFFAGSAHLAADALSIIEAQNEVIAALCKVGYPHGFEQEKPWIINYMNSITEVIKKAVKWNVI